MREYNFNISLSVLNHLGRNLYRSLITILGEAISNSWDADANLVDIIYDKKKNRMIIIDDGEGMNEYDFENKFLKIGYSKRKDKRYKSKKGRPFIGRKGIGKLALLSCAEYITIVTKKNNRLTGGCIDNKELDAAITDDINSSEYKLKNYNSSYEEYLKNVKHGTAIIFDKLNINQKNTDDYLKKLIALYFRFSIIDKKFKIKFNGNLITDKELQELSESTQFIWIINNAHDPIVKKMINLQNKSVIKNKLKINGFIATVDKPSNLKIKGTDETVGVDLYVNGRVRETDILKHKPQNRIVENYTYGEIFFDELDTKNKRDVFTSSREGIVDDSEEYRELLNEIGNMYKRIMDEWDNYRRKNLQDGDPDNISITKSERKAEELFNETFNGYASIKKKKENNKNEIDKWISVIQNDSRFNIPAYVNCYISENIIRKYIELCKIELPKKAKDEVERCRNSEKKNMNAANISYKIRKKQSNIYYLSMDYLTELANNVKGSVNIAGLTRTALQYKPIRDAVCHTSLITSNAQNSLKLSLENIKAKIKELLEK